MKRNSSRNNYTVTEIDDRKFLMIIRTLTQSWLFDLNRVQEHYYGCKNVVVIVKSVSSVKYGGVRLAHETRG